MRAVLLALLVGACSHPSLLDAAVDAGADGGCDVNAWATSCGPGLVCASDSTCGTPCGNGNVVCDPTTLCTAQADCVPPCRNPDGSIVVLDPVDGSCSAAGYLEPANGGACILPCWYALCTSTRHGYGGGCF